MTNVGGARKRRPLQKAAATKANPKKADPSAPCRKGHGTPVGMTNVGGARKRRPLQKAAATKADPQKADPSAACRKRRGTPVGMTNVGGARKRRPLQKAAATKANPQKAVSLRCVPQRARHFGRDDKCGCGRGKGARFRKRPLQKLTPKKQIRPLRAAKGAALRSG